MNRWLAPLVLGLALLMPAMAFAADPPPPAELIQVAADPVVLDAGTAGTAVVRVTVLAPWHVNANPPTLDYNIPTEVSLRGGSGVRVGTPVYPAGRMMKFGFEDQPLAVYDGTFEVRMPLSVAADAASGTRTLNGFVAFQACDDQVCLAPARVPFAVTLEVRGGASAGATPPSEGTVAAGEDTATMAVAAGGEPAAEGFMTAPPEGEAGAAHQQLVEKLRSGGMTWVLALFIGGILLNLTPCVFPMLGVTVSIFGARRKEPLPKVVMTALVYVLGICTTYTALGVVAALTGGLFGAALQNPLVNVALGALMLVLSLGMFGVFEMQAPTWVLDRLGGANTASVAGVFLSGLGVGIIAAPCVGPFVVAVLALIAQQQSVAFGIQTMFTLSLGLGFPYLFLAGFSNLLQSLPRSGDWMVWVKKVFGVLLAGIGLQYVLIGFAPEWSVWTLPAGLLLGGLYLGFMEKSGNAQAAFLRGKRIAGTLAVVGGVVLTLQVMQAKSRSIVFEAYDEQAVARSLAAGRPVMLDFTAAWCVPCRELEHITFVDRGVVAAAREWDAYKVDLTQYDSPASQAAREKYRVTGVPTIVFLRPDGTEAAAARVIGFIGPAPFRDKLAQALAP